ncbi:MAG: 4-hydroxy-tetrahydrodipicolinate synthase [candidate division WS1 bacterium]|jgi:4-hydroxy-tetrahydrodipicolinate synthase|nr:4-hydroxy-tetrahydrodipicolinate synthase [candidate division WS1 bacterium]
MPQPGMLITAMVTPFDDDLNVDFDRLGALAQRLADAGSDLLVSGTTGESPTTSAEEKLEMFRVVREAVGRDVSIMAGTGGNDTARSIALTQKASELGVDSILLVGPYYNKPSQEGFYQHFKAVAESTDLPVILYNVPGRTGKNIEAATVLRVAEDVENVIGVKEASGDLEQIATICRDAPDGFRVWSGDDINTLPILAVGGYGVISVAGHIAPEEIGEMMDCYHNGEVARATELHHRLMPLFDACFLASGNPPCVKRALEVCGFPVGGTRLPVVPASEKDTATIREVCERLGYA